MNWIFENWQGLLGGGSLSSIISYFINRKNSKADLLEKMQASYDRWVEDGDKKSAELKEDIVFLKNEVQDLRVREKSLQNQFNEIYLSYTKEVEKTQYWIQKYDELSKKYEELSNLYKNLEEKYREENKDYVELKKLYDKLKIDFDKYKKNGL